MSAVILDASGRMLLVRKHGSAIFIQPGGKPEAGESALDTLKRELDEELGVRVVEDSAVCVGQFEDEAVHEVGWRIRTETWLVSITGTPAASAEIAELQWVEPASPGDLNIAPLSRHHILPAVVARETS
ncbi:MAG: NUDIX domain-containing protein [Wenzhouxiangella sp.]|nr:MAG: NUDIX domain-containing protein [Wenzhouxiangella sp.]